MRHQNHTRRLPHHPNIHAVQQVNVHYKRHKWGSIVRWADGGVDPSSFRVLHRLLLRLVNWALLAYLERPPPTVAINGGASIFGRWGMDPFNAS